MKTITSTPYHITYPFYSKITYKQCNPFIRIITKNNVFYGFINKKLFFIDLKSKPIKKVLIFNQIETINELNISSFNQATKNIQGIQYTPLFTNNNRYLCIGKIHDINTTLVVITIELNSNGYYEIVGIRNCIK